MGRSWTPPPLSAVRAFEAAARSLNFTRAALELNVTQSAVSHGVRELETRLGARLFLREGRQLVLSDAGRTYLPFACEALASLRTGAGAIINPARRARILTVSVSPSFAAKWLVPRLGEFSAAHPDLDLRISANPQHVDFSDDEIDLAVRHGDGNWPQLACVQLCTELLFPVCSPVSGRNRQPQSIEDLNRCVLLHHRSRDAWTDWLRAVGADALATAAHGPVFNEMSLTIDAAVAGQGVALARSALAARDLAEGRLIRALPDAAPASYAYWVVSPRTTATEPKIERFRNWLLDAARSDVAVVT